MVKVPQIVVSFRPGYIMNYPASSSGEFDPDRVNRKYPIILGI